MGEVREKQSIEFCAETLGKEKQIAPIQLEFGLPEVLAPPTEAIDGIKKYLNPNLFKHPATMHDVSKNLRAGKLVVIRDAFVPDFANMVYDALSAEDLKWECREMSSGHRYHRISDERNLNTGLMAAARVFEHDASKEFMTALTGRDCKGFCKSASHWLKEGAVLHP